MKILVRSVEPGLKRLIAWGDGPEPDRLVGYLRREPSGRWMLVDHISGHDVDYSENGYRDVVLVARTYFATRSFCARGCGRLTAAEGDPTGVGTICATCAGEMR